MQVKTPCTMCNAYTPAEGLGRAQGSAPTGVELFWYCVQSPYPLWQGPWASGQPLQV